MASTYTDNSGIEKPGSGEQSGTWGDTTNTNFDIIDRVLSGVGPITLSGTTHTLTTSQGASSDGHYKVLVLGGSPSGENTITISPNDQDKVYLVHNNTSQSAVFTQGSGSNATVAAGKFSWIFADGAGATAAVTKMTVDTASIEDGSVTSAKIADGTIATADIADDAVTSAKIADTTIVAGNIANNTITATQIAADAVGASELADNAVDTAAIANNAVTAAKLASDAIVFTSGTKMLFQQTAAPTGWTKVTSHNDKALRVVSGTAGTGGSVAFETAFANKSVAGTISNSVSGSTASHTLTVNQIPSHTHDLGFTGRGGGGSENVHEPGSGGNVLNFTTNATGGSQGHSHGAGSLAVSSTFSGTAINLDVRFVDVIIAAKD